MSKKTYKMSLQEQLDAFIPIIAVVWVLIFSYISYFIPSKTLALITVMPVFFLYALFSIGSALYTYKELEIAEALGKDTYEIKKRHLKKKPKLNTGKLTASGISAVVGILLCIFL